jgi:hypothetical protein
MSEDDTWRLNYFNYYTEIEEQFQRARGTGLFLLSPLDWALIETWKSSGVPLEAVLRGIDAAFEKWRSKKSKTQRVNSLAFCAQAVLTEAQAMDETGAGSAARRESEPPFPQAAVTEYLRAGAAKLAGLGAAYGEIAAAVERLAAAPERSLEELDIRLTALEEKAAATARAGWSEQQLVDARLELERQMRPYRGKMSAEQLSMVERKYLDRIVFERAGLPRLSLFYMQ